jgi:hypothetical protein
MGVECVQKCSITFFNAPVVLQHDGDLAQFQCYVRNRVQTWEEANVEVREEVPSVSAYPKVVHTLPGEEVVLNCELQTQPLGTRIEWTQNDRLIKPGGRFKIRVKKFKLLF